MGYTNNEVYNKTIEYFNGDELATDVWMNKYALRDSGGNFKELTPNDMHKRIASELARIEKTYKNPISYDEIFNLIKNFKYFVPAGSPMFGIGNNNSIVSLSNCYVVGHNTDSYGGIVMDDHDMVQLFKRRGGVGLDLSHLRPNSSSVKNSAGTSTGAASFMDRYSHSTNEVAQSGRRGALILTINIEHPDSEEFIDAKIEQGKVTGANISVKMSNNFMKAVENDEDFIQTFPVDLDITRHTAFMEEEFNGNIKYNKLYNLQYYNDNEYKGCYAKKINAKRLWNKIIKNAHSSAEPGLLLWDNILNESLGNSYGGDFKETSTNPCSELPLPPYDSCRLSSINLYSYVNKPFTEEAAFNFDLFETHVKIAQKLMDDIVDLEEEKVNSILNKIDNDPEIDEIKQIEKDVWVKIKKMLKNGRRTGLGVTGLGDMLAALNIQYSSEKSLEFINKVFEKFALNSYISSIEMARDRGSFPIWNGEKEMNNPFLRRILNNIKGTEYEYLYSKYGRRNLANNTLAPNGSISILTQTTSGIEPAFMLYYKRRRKVDKEKSVKAVFKDNNGNWWEEYSVFHHKFVDWFIVNYWDKVTDKEKLEMNVKTPIEWLKGCSTELLDKYVEESPYYKAIANEINYLNKVKMQGGIQKWIDHSISVTHNLPKDVSQQEVSDIYLYAWKDNCKGVTIYRDGSREGVLVSNNDNEKKEIDNEFSDRDAVKRPKELVSDIYVVTVKGEKWVVSVGLLDNKPYEVFAFKQDTNDPSFKSGDTGVMKRLKRGYYQLCFGDESCIDDITDRMSDEEEALTRIISWGLRHGGGIKFAVEQLNKTKGDMTLFSKSIARTLKRYIKNGDKVTGSTCDICGSDNVVYKDGCESCMACGSEKCS